VRARSLRPFRHPRSEVHSANYPNEASLLQCRPPTFLASDCGGGKSGRIDPALIRYLAYSDTFDTFTSATSALKRGRPNTRTGDEGSTTGSKWRHSVVLASMLQSKVLAEEEVQHSGSATLFRAERDREVGAKGRRITIKYLTLTFDSSRGARQRR
jgi:hypothetical protein